MQPRSSNPETPARAVRPAAHDGHAAGLESLAAEMSARGYQARLHTPPGRLPYLDIRNPRLPILSEKIYAQAGWYWYSWAERIAPRDDLAGAARVLARVLRATGGGPQ